MTKVRTDPEEPSGSEPGEAKSGDAQRFTEISIVAKLYPPPGGQGGKPYGQLYEKSNPEI